MALMFNDVLQQCGCRLVKFWRENSQPVQHSSTHARKPNSSVDHEGMVFEQIRELRKQRGGVLSSLTARRREIDSLLMDEKNLETVKAKLSEITSLFQRFVDAQDTYNAALFEENQTQESDVYFAEIETSLHFFCGTINIWLRVTEARLQDNEITPDDSTSQLGFNNNNNNNNNNNLYTRGSTH